MYDKTRVKIVHGHDWDEVESEVNNFIATTPDIDVKAVAAVTGTESTSRAVIIRYIDYTIDKEKNND